MLFTSIFILLNWSCVTYHDNVFMPFCDSNENITIDVSLRQKIHNKNKEKMQSETAKSKSRIRLYPGFHHLKLTKPYKMNVKSRTYLVLD